MECPAANLARFGNLTFDNLALFVIQAADILCHARSSFQFPNWVR